MTLKEFWESKDKLVIHCNTEEKIEKLCDAFDVMGKKWRDGTSYKHAIDWWICKEEFCYYKDTFCGYERYDLSGYTIIEFDDIEDFKQPEIKAQFGIKDIQTGDFIKMNDGTVGVSIIEKNIIVYQDGGNDKIEDIDFTKNDIDYYVIEVYRPKENNHCSFYNYCFGGLIYRYIPIPTISIEEAENIVSEVKGRKVKIER